MVSFLVFVPLSRDCSSYEMAWFTSDLTTYPQWGSDPPSSDKCFQGDITTYTTQAEEAKKWREIRW